MKELTSKNAGIASVAAAIIFFGAAFFVSGGIVLRQKFFHSAQPSITPTQESNTISLKDLAGQTVTETKPKTLKPNPRFDRLIVKQPQEGDIISNDTLVVEGTGWGWFEGTVPVEVRDGAGLKLYEGFFNLFDENYARPAYFYKEIKLNTQPMTSTGTIVFTDYSMKDGSVVFKKEIRIAFKKATRNIQLFYYNKVKDLETMCGSESVLPVTRVMPISNTPIQDAIKLLLAGELQENEIEQGFQTEFPIEGLRLLGANLKNGILTLEFEDLMNGTSGGSCRVNLLSSQIAKTAMQFPEVKEVRFLPETIFQP